MNPIIIIAAAGIGAFLLFGKKKEQKALPPGDDDSRPIPPIPPILPDPDVEPEGELGASYGELWDAYPYEAYWYPATERKERVPPPPTWDGISIGARCRTIAVGQGWWERVGQFAKFMIDRGEVDVGHITEAIMAHYVSACGGVATAATKALRAEIVEHLEDALSPGPGVGQPMPGQISVQKNGIVRGMKKAKYDQGMPWSKPADAFFSFGTRNCGPSRYTLPEPGPPMGARFGPRRNRFRSHSSSQNTYSLEGSAASPADPFQFGLVVDPMKQVNVAAAWSRRRESNGGTNGTDSSPQGVSMPSQRAWRNRGLLSALARAPKRRVVLRR